MTSCVVYILEVESFENLLNVSNVWMLEKRERVRLVYALQSKFYEKASAEFLNVSNSYAEVNVQIYVVLKRKKSTAFHIISSKNHECSIFKFLLISY